MNKISNLHKKILKAAGRASKLDPNRHVKNIIAGNYLQDSLLFIQKFDVLKHSDSFSVRSYRAKALVDMYMSIECGLKSIIISAGPISENAVDAYKTARKSSHSLHKLFEEAKNRCAGKIAFPKVKPETFDDITVLKVDSRYGLDVWTHLANSSSVDRFLGKDVVSKTIDSDGWASQVRKEAIRIYNIAGTSVKRFTSPHGPISGGELDQIAPEIDSFLRSLVR